MLLCFLTAGIVASAYADAALLLEEPFGGFGAMNPTGHAAVYLTDVCAASLTELRPCHPGEAGVVISRYHHVGGYDWIAIPLIPYLYAVENVNEIPETASPRLELHLRDAYRRKYLMSIAPDDPKREIPRGEWIQLVGSSYDRRIWGFEVATTAEQDRQLIEQFNQGGNKAHFNLLFRNCANFSETVMNFYYPHAVHRNFIVDVGIMTPKQIARSLVKYDRHHDEMDMRTFVIPQVPGSIPRSKSVDGVIESLVKSKKYVLPLALLHPVVAGSLVAAYIVDGRFHTDPKAVVYEPESGLDPGESRETAPGASHPSAGTGQGMVESSATAPPDTSTESNGQGSGVRVMRTGSRE
ncbi:hypothetical protein [Paracidobacterium acidisoli]|uniref:DUF4105 domain-containing protein n=1 Tax=Paracidobacterium acidisoli TaxID=2303751 RepID=A0A372IS23_9BACT|nr:hypothetical protein [Paracidobacterium acidisoli]MBT9330454.1 hypothetical protein [Paracidobacterium acidisoli]